MPYAVTCKACGARFSVADDLFRKKLQGKMVTLRCRQCGAAIRINASKPPAPPVRLRDTAGRDPGPEASSQPLPTSEDLEDEATFVALSPGLLTSAAPPRSKMDPGVSSSSASKSVVDLSELAKSEPPSGISEPPVSSSNAPKLSELVHAPGPHKSRGSEDVDFLLGLSGSPGTNAALTGPALPDFSDAPDLSTLDESRTESTKAPAKTAPPSSAAAPRSAATPGTGAPPNESRLLRYVLFGAALFGAAYVVIGRVREADQQQPAPAVLAAPASAEAPEAQTSTAPEAEAAPEAEPEMLDADAELARRPHHRGTPKASEAAQDEAQPKEPASSAQNGVTPEIPAESADEVPPKTQAAPGTAFDRGAAASALTAAAAQATSCRKPGDPSGTASVVVTFAPSGRVTSATLNGPPFAGTATGGCIASTLRGARVPAFEGEKVTVAKTVVIQ